VSGLRTVVVDAGDGGSGVRRVELLVDGAVVDAQEQAGDCTPPYSVADPCPGTLRSAFALDTTTLTPGPHVFALRATDAAGTSTASTEHAFTVVHPTGLPGSPPAAPAPAVSTPAPPESPAPAALRVTAPRHVGLPTRATVTGTVTTTAGMPRGAIRLRFDQRPLDGGDDDWRPLEATAITDGAGRFRVPAPAASAEVRALVGPEFAASPAIVEFVRPLTTTIVASRERLRNGQRLTLRGRLQHAGGAGDGRTVLVQSRVGATWRSVDSIETGPNGRISWRYRFTSTRQTARYRFRFVVPRTKGLPWKRSVSRQVSVVVRPR
jgi:hypothetical protein